MSTMNTRVDYPITPVSFRSVTLQDRFWMPRLSTNRTVTIPAVFRKCEDSGRIDNFRRAAGLLPGPYVGKMPFEDTDVYKAIEGASYSLSVQPDRALDAYLDGLIDLVAAAQEPDGYLYTNRTIDPAHVLPFAGPQRWSNLGMSHELYNCGHLYEAACAHSLATGKPSLLRVAERSAALLRSVFGPDGRHDTCGHPIVEMGLARLYRVTGDRGCLEAARFFLEQRGRHESRPLYMYADNPGYSQDHQPVREQRTAVGHAVRAAYMYCGMADVAALLPEEEYAEAIREIWQDVVDTKIYITGGIGARHQGEAFGAAHELPNDTAYAETCASIGSVMWNHRLFLLSGESKYYDVLEQTLYNGLLSGVSLSGDEYFYVNPLESDGTFPFNHGSAGRQPWFDVSCCPTNLCRFFPSLPGYSYGTAADALYVNLFIASQADIEVDGASVRIVQETDYPWSGSVRMRISVGGRRRMRLLVRIPGWSQERVLGGHLYRFERPSMARPSLRINGEAADITLEKGYAVIGREWQDEDIIELSLPMPVRTVACDPRVISNLGKAAVQRGPLVYCVEGRDAAGPLGSLQLDGQGARGARLEAQWRPDLLGGVVAIRGPGFTAIPYFAWSNRGAGPMRVWLERTQSAS
ncbi:MAG TPA: glycoside hydrolase family 127 protein [Spirochaetia bacterium]|nr:glycoside hydrolase family 127 protein [Spirochaetia bacterium]